MSEYSSVRDLVTGTIELRECLKKLKSISENINYKITEDLFEELEETDENVRKRTSQLFFEVNQLSGFLDYNLLSYQELLDKHIANFEEG